jgi:hypothetical protein
MRNLHLTVENEVVRIKDTDGILYTIRKSELPLTRGENNSEWIMQLLEKTWINTQILYQLAKLTQKEFPDNDIDWRATFFVVEKSEHIEALVKEGDSFRDRIKLGQRENNAETNRLIYEKVDENLKAYGLR